MKIVGGKNKQLFTKVDSNFGASSVSDVFLKYKATIINELTKNLHESGKDQPGKLIQSVDVKIGIDGSSVSFKLFMEDYWKFVDEGVQGEKGGITSQYKFKHDGKPANMGAMLDFIKVRGIAQYKEKDGTIIYDINAETKNSKQIKTLKNKTVRKAVKQVNITKRRLTLAYLLGMRMKRWGIKPTYFFSDVINDELHFAIKKDLEIALKKEIELSFTIN